MSRDLHSGFLTLRSTLKKVLAGNTRPLCQSQQAPPSWNKSNDYQVPSRWGSNLESPLISPQIGIPDIFLPLRGMIAFTMALLPFPLQKSKREDDQRCHAV
jgi:hypothetical protein